MINNQIAELGREEEEQKEELGRYSMALEEMALELKDKEKDKQEILDQIEEANNEVKQMKDELETKQNELDMKQEELFPNLNPVLCLLMSLCPE